MESIAAPVPSRSEIQSVANDVVPPLFRMIDPLEPYEYASSTPPLVVTSALLPSTTHFPAGTTTLVAMVCASVRNEPIDHPDEVDVGGTGVVDLEPLAEGVGAGSDRGGTR